MENLEALVKDLKSHTPQGVTLLEYEPMSRHTSFRIGGPVRLMAVAHGAVAGVAALLAAAHKQGVIPLLMGNGSDLLAPDQGMDALVVKTTASDLEVEGTTITARSGALLSQLASCALDHGLTGLEFAHGIPGTVGGGVTMNAGAYGGELGRRVTEVLWLDRAGEEQVSQNADCRFDYRKSAFSGGERYIATVKFSLEPGDPAVIRGTMEELCAKRREKQPLDYPSAGSTFKRPEGYFAAALIEQCGLKGCAVGGAQVSEKHAGFVVNRGGATAADVQALMARVAETVARETGVTLEPEVKIL